MQSAGLFESPVLAPLQGAWFVGSHYRGSCSRATPGYDLAPLQGDQASTDAIFDQPCAIGGAPCTAAIGTYLKH